MLHPLLYYSLSLLALFIHTPFYVYLPIPNFHFPTNFQYFIHNRTLLLYSPSPIVILLNHLVFTLYPFLSSDPHPQNTPSILVSHSSPHLLTPSQLNHPISPSLIYSTVGYPFFTLHPPQPQPLPLYPSPPPHSPSTPLPLPSSFRKAWHVLTWLGNIPTPFDYCCYCFY